jgi:hypothetical protein
VRVAYFSPMPPERTGVADYSALLAPALAARLELTVVRRGRKRPPRGADVALYHVGNNPDAHAWIVDALRRHPGVVAHGVLDKRIPPLWESRPEDFPLAGLVLEHATGLIVHSCTVRDLAREAGYDRPIRVVPHPAWPVPDTVPERVGTGPVVGCFGVVNSSKRIP